MMGRLFADVSRAARGADLDRRSPGVGGVPRVHIDIEVHVHGNTVAMCAPAVPYVDGCFAVAPRSPERRCPIARRTGGRRTGAPPPRSGAEPPSRVGIIGRERPRGDGGRGAQTHLPPNPYQALGLGGRSHHRQSGPCGAGRSGRVGARRGRVAAYTVARVRIAGGPKCASAPRVVCALQCGRKSRAGHR